jgi:O-6-methylguanine DNA methyltransferase
LTQISSAKRDGIWFSVAVNQKKKLVACAFSDKNRREAEKAILNSLPAKTSNPANGRRAHHKSFRILTDFYRGKGRKDSLQILDFSSVSSFRRKVYNVLCQIPLGRVTTYGAIAQRLGGKRYARAVGTAVATNPLPLVIPCHRVVPASLEIGNYGMCGRKPSTGAYMKRMLLEREGVKFQGQKVSKRSTWIPN